MWPEASNNFSKSTFQKVHNNEVVPRVPGDPRVPVFGYPKAGSQPGKNTKLDCLQSYFSLVITRSASKTTNCTVYKVIFV